MAVQTALKAAQNTRARDGAGKSQDSRATERDLKAFLASQMGALVKSPGRTKRTAARLALAAAIKDGFLVPGATLPPEKALTTILNVSLGTVQAALRQLQDTGVIVRRRGDGTRVASVEPLGSSIWHFRFLIKKTGLPARFASQRIEIDTVSDGGPWSDFLPDAAHFVRIRRHIFMIDGSRIFAEMYLAEAAAAGLAEIDPTELDMVNIRPYLEERFGLRTASARHTVETMMPGDAEVRGFRFKPAIPYFKIHARAYSAEGNPVYFQRIFADSSRYVVDF